MPDISGTNPSSEIVRKQLESLQQGKDVRRNARQIASEKAQDAFEEQGFNIQGLAKNFKELEKNTSLKKQISKSQHAEDDVEIIEETAKTEEAATRFNKKNDELKTKTLIILRDTIKDDDTVEDILRKVLDFYPDYTLADDALDFLLMTTVGALQRRVHQAKEFLNAHFRREIVAGRNMNLQAQIFSKEGMGNPTFLRDMYRDITGNPKTAFDLFDELALKFPYDSMKKVVRFLLHSLGADLKSKGPSISRGELTKLMDDVQTLQAITGLFKFFNSRQNLINSQFEHFGLIKPSIVNFELIAKQYMSLLKERYISTDKILQLAKYLGISHEIAAQIIVFTQMRDATRNTSKRLYQSDKQREDVLNLLIQTIEELDERLEEEE